MHGSRRQTDLYTRVSSPELLYWTWNILTPVTGVWLLHLIRAEFPVSSTSETLRSAPLVSLLGSATFEEVRMSEGAGSEDGSRLRLVLFARLGVTVTTSSTLPVDSPAALEAMQVKFPESFTEVALISRLPFGKTNVLKRVKNEDTTKNSFLATQSLIETLRFNLEEI